MVLPYLVDKTISLSIRSPIVEVELRKPRNLFVCVSEDREDGERGEREGEDTSTLSLSSGTHRIQNSLTENGGRLPVVEL